jgi:hypothetical protein
LPCGWRIVDIPAASVLDTIERAYREAGFRPGERTVKAGEAQLRVTFVVKGSPFEQAILFHLAWGADTPNDLYECGEKVEVNMPPVYAPGEREQYQRRFDRAVTRAQREIARRLRGHLQEPAEHRN